MVKHLENLKKADGFKPKHAETVLKMVDQLQDILKYDISVIEFESDDYNDATELYIRFNSTGRKLNRTDLVLAELATRIGGLTSHKMGEMINEWGPNFIFTRPFLILCLASVHTGRMDLRNPEEVWRESAPNQIMDSWSKTTHALDSIVEFLTGTVKWDSESWLPSFNALIPLVYIKAKGGSFDLQSKKLARKWLLLTGVHSYFSGAVYSQLDQLLRKLSKEPTIDQLWKITHKDLPKLRKDDLKISRRSSPLMSLFISALHDEDARDWVSDNPLNGTVLGKSAKLHIHHFFPSALLSKHEFKSEWINTFANYTVLCASTNLDISAEEPATYLPRLEPLTKHLEAQCIPLDSNLWHVANYEEFLNKREQLLLKKFNNYLDIL